MPKKKNGHGGKRVGAGRPFGSGSGPSPNSRMHRVAITLTTSDLKKLTKLAKKHQIPVATEAFNRVKRSLDRS